MRTIVFVVILATSAFAGRLVFTIAFRGGLSTVPAQKIAGADGVEYDLLARNVVAGNSYSYDGQNPTAFRAPGLPLYLVVLYSVFGVNYPAAYVSFAIWGALGAVATYLFASELLVERAARCAGLFAAFYPASIYDSSYFYSEVVFAPCLGFGLWLLARSIRTRSLAASVGAGLLLGYAALTRSFGILFLPIFALYLCFALPRGWRAGIAYGIAFVAVVAPWTIRNYLVFDRPVLIATNGGSTFYGANNDFVTSSPREYGNWVSTTHLPGRDLIDAQPDEVSHDKMEWRLGIDWVKSHPQKFALLCVAKMVRFWLPFVQYPSFNRYPIANIGLMMPLLGLILLGIFRTLKCHDGRRAFVSLHLTLLANLIMVLIFWGDPRFRDANVPVLAIYAVAGLWWLRRRSDVPWRSGPESTLPTPVATKSNLC